MECIEAGTLLGAVLLGRLLHKGSSSQLYEGRHVRLDMDVAVRVMHGAPIEDRERFTREARISSSLKHPTPVRAIDFGEYSNLRYLATPRIVGRTLEQYIAENRQPLSEDAIVKLLTRVGETLRVCHDAGLAHRDLQPSHLCIDGRGQLRILDFGFAPSTAHAGGGPDAPFRERSRYLPPECMRPDVPIEAPADLFALGVIAYQLAFQHLPYKTWLDEDAWNVEDLEPAPLDLPSHCSVPLLSVIDRLIRPDPMARTSTASELLSLLPAEPRGPRAPRPAPPAAAPEREPESEPPRNELHRIARFLERWFGSATTSHASGAIVHSSLLERWMIWLLMLSLVGFSLYALWK